MRNLNLLPRGLRFFAEPFEVMLGTSSLVSGIPALLGSVHPSSLALQLSPAWVHVWGLMLCLGGVVTLWARWRIAQWDLETPSDRRLISALRAEVAGMMLLATSMGVYALAILLVGLLGLQAGSLIAGWSVAFGLRAWIVSRSVKRFVKSLRPGAAPDG